jgi:hypothetical protein
MSDFDILNFLNGFKDKNPNPEPEKSRLKPGTKIKIKKGAVVYFENSGTYAILQDSVEAVIE